MAHPFEVGDIVRATAQPEWGEGQVQSNIDGRITVNFQHAGKVVLSGDQAGLVLVRPDWS
ncbi:MAG: DUF3553 domain-containing protein [Pikeienuella sp.]